MYRLFAIFLLGLTLATRGADVPSSDEVLTVGGELQRMTISTMTRQGVLQQVAGKPVPLEEIWRVRLHHEATPKMVGRMRITGAGYDVKAESVTLSDTGVSVLLHAGIKWGAPLDSLRSLRTGIIHAEAAATFAAALEADGETDRLVALSGSGSVLSLEGEVTGFDGKTLSFIFRGETKSLAVEKVYGVVFASVDRPVTAAAYRVVLQDDSWIDASDVWLDSAVKGGLTTASGEFTIDRRLIQMIIYRNPRIQVLSELEPLSAQADAIAGPRLRWQPDANAMGRTMRIGDQIYETGVGVHAPSSLTYAVPPGAGQFVASIGLDTTLGRIGDCVIVVETDGVERVRRRLLGGAAAEPVVLDIAGVRSITLRVEAGENFDLGDYANWGDARFIVVP